MDIQSIRLETRCYDRKVLKNFCERVDYLIEKHQLNLKSVIKLPTKKRIYTVIRSPHIDKKSREQFETRVYKKTFVIKCLYKDSLENARQKYLNFLSDFGKQEHNGLELVIKISQKCRIHL